MRCRFALMATAEDIDRRAPRKSRAGSSSGQSGTSLFRPPSIDGHLAGDDKVRARLLCGAWQSIPSAVAIKVKRQLIVPPAVRHQASRWRG